MPNRESENVRKWWRGETLKRDVVRENGGMRHRNPVLQGELPARKIVSAGSPLGKVTMMMPY